jgi:hypothetical protein
MSKEQSVYPGQPTGRLRVNTNSSEGHRAGVNTPAMD